MKIPLLCLALLAGPAALAQLAPAFPPLPETSLVATIAATTVHNEVGVRYQYQLVHLTDDRVWLAPAWRGQIRLEPAQKFFNTNLAGDLDVLLMQTLNELAADGWELLEIRTINQPSHAVQELEKENKYNDPQRPVYTATTSIRTASETRYLFRRALPKS